MNPKASFAGATFAGSSFGAPSFLEPPRRGTFSKKTNLQITVDDEEIIRKDGSDEEDRSVELDDHAQHSTEVDLNSVQKQAIMVADPLLGVNVQGSKPETRIKSGHYSNRSTGAKIEDFQSVDIASSNGDRFEHNFGMGATGERGETIIMRDIDSDTSSVKRFDQAFKGAGLERAETVIVREEDSDVASLQQQINKANANGGTPKVSGGGSQMSNPKVAPPLTSKRKQGT